MDFRLTDDQLSIQSIARDFAQKRIAPVAAELDASGQFPLDNIREMGQLGLMGIEVPEEYGGAGLDPVAYALAMIEIGAADTAHSTIMSVNNSLYCNGILQHGTEEQKQKYVRAIASGEHIGAYALTEPQSGSDASAMHTHASRNADGDWVINGKKSWITSGPVAR
jgi:alkylation response protein AidB-like acyl-CoA dehydrogenase